jgi:aspartyl-tRNA(Asn)/glutamyl-tRNA(Gln) amidotransferase subunit A
MSRIPLSITEAAENIRSGELSSVSLTEAMLAHADVVDPQIGIYLARFNETALAQAAVADQELAAGLDRGPMQGIPVGIKDVLYDSNGPTTGQSLIPDPSWGAGRDAPVVARLKAAGAVITGKLTTMEFGMGMPDGTKPFPLPRNPWNTDTWTGGSSSGAANGVATGMFLAGIGSDTGGSIRIPAALCGVSGLMPTFGRVPKSGAIPLGYSLDHVGPLARSARDCAAVLDVIAGYHPSDPDSIEVPVGEYLAALDGTDGSLAGLRVGVDRIHTLSDAADPAVAPAFEAALEALAARGATLVDVSLPYYAEMTAVCAITVCSELSAYHARDFRSRWGDFFGSTRQMAGFGALINAPDYVQAQRVRRVVQHDLLALFADVDTIATPTSEIPAPLFASTTDEIAIAGMKIFHLFHTAYWNPTGCPALAVPMGFNADGLPLSLQFGGRPFDEATLLKIADAYQQDTQWHRTLPPLLQDAIPA